MSVIEFDCRGEANSQDNADRGTAMKTKHGGYLLVRWTKAMIDRRRQTPGLNNGPFPSQRHVSSCSGTTAIRLT